MSNCQIAATFLVAGLNAKIGMPEYDNLNSSFLAAPLQWDKIRNSSLKFQCLVGSNDPYVPFEQPISISQQLNCSPIIIKDGGHLNSESGYSEFPLLISELTKMLK